MSKKLVNFQSQESPSLCCTKSGEILVCLPGASKKSILGDTVYFRTVTVFRYSDSGEKIKEVQILNEKGRYPELKEEWPICENVNGDICTGHRFQWNLNLSNKVLVYDKSCQFRFTYDMEGGNRKFRSFDPRGLSTDSQGNILISDGENHAVHLISQDGDFITHLMTKNDGISYPWGISVDQADNLWLVEEKSAKVKVYQYLQ
jgi:hypothetical protein